jgi:hypothetical protein
MNDTTTPSRQNPAVALASEVLGRPLQAWVVERRNLGQSWDRMARDLARDTDGKCQFSRELLRRHFGDIPRGTE